VRIPCSGFSRIYPWSLFMRLLGDNVGQRHPNSREPWHKQVARVRPLSRRGALHVADHIAQRLFDSHPTVCQLCPVPLLSNYEHAEPGRIVHQGAAVPAGVGSGVIYDVLATS